MSAQPKRNAKVVVRRGVAGRRWMWERRAAGNSAVVAISPNVFDEKSNALRAARTHAKLDGADVVIEDS